MSNDNLKGVIISDGEAITHGDLNDSQRFAMSRLMDQILEKLVPGPGQNLLTRGTVVQFPGKHGDNVPSTAPGNASAFAVTSGGAYPRKGSTNAKIQIAPGTLLQKITARTGNEPTFLPYTFTGTEEVTIANGDPAQPRVDLVQMKLEWEDGDLQSRDFQDAVTGANSSLPTNKKRRVKCTLAVKQGAPAVSPIYPDPDAGFVAVAGVVVPATWAGVAAPVTIDSASANSLVIHDQRLPLGTPRTYHVGAAAAIATQSGGTTWVLSADRSYLSCPGGGAASDLLAPLPANGGSGGGGIGRLLSVGMATATTAFAPNVTFYIARRSTTPAVPPTKVITDLNFVNIGGAGQIKIEDAFQFDQRHQPAVGPTVQASATNLIGVPVWCNGRRALEPSDFTTVHTTDDGLVLRWPDPGTAGDSYFTRATFVVAEGL